MESMGLLQASISTTVLAVSHCSHNWEYKLTHPIEDLQKLYIIRDTPAPEDHIQAFTLPSITAQPTLAQRAVKNENEASNIECVVPRCAVIKEEEGVPAVETEVTQHVKQEPGLVKRQRDDDYEVQIEAVVTRPKKKYRWILDLTEDSD